MKSAVFRSANSRAALERVYDLCLAETPQARSLRVPTRFGETHLLVAGPEHAPPLVLLHGAMTNAAQSLREAHPLLDRLRVYALDIPGQSPRSADVRLRWKGSDVPDWLLDVLDALALPRAHVCGASSGGYIARTLAERAPDRIDRLALIVPAAIIRGPALAGMTRIALPLALFRATGSRWALERFLASLLTVRDPRLEECLATALEHYQLDLSIPPLATPEALAGFHRPTLVIAGSDDITAPGAALLARAREVFPHAILELLPGCKHIPPTDDVSRAKMGERIASFLLAEDEAPRQVTG